MPHDHAKQALQSVDSVLEGIDSAILSYHKKTLVGWELHLVRRRIMALTMNIENALDDVGVDPTEVRETL